MKFKNIEKKILYVSHCSNIGGAERVLISFLENVTKFNPIVLSPRGPLSKELISKKINYISSSFLGRINKEKNSITWPLILIFRFIFSQFEIIYLILKYKPSIIHSNTYYASAYAVLPSIITKKKHIWHMHDFPFQGFAHNILMKFIFKYSYKLVVVSNSVRNDFIARGFDGNKIKVIYNSVEITVREDTFSNELASIDQLRHDNKIVIGVVGTIEERKGIYECVEVTSKLPNSVLFIAGGTNSYSDEKYKNKIYLRTKELNIENRIFFLGKVANIFNFYKKIDCLIHFPKYNDPLPTVILEAIYSDCPVIVSDNGGNMECIGYGKWGNFFKHSRPDELIKIISSENIKRLSTAEKSEFLKFFSFERKQNDFLSLYKPICG